MPREAGTPAVQDARQQVPAHRVGAQKEHGAIMDAKEVQIARKETQQGVGVTMGEQVDGVDPVSYTHLDVYKRQACTQ